jgi:hypothetical protein
MQQIFEIRSIRKLRPKFIITGKTALYEPNSSLEASSRFGPICASQKFTISQQLIFFCTARLLTLNLASNLESQVPVFMSPSPRVAQLCL